MAKSLNDRIHESALDETLKKFEDRQNQHGEDSNEANDLRRVLADYSNSVGKIVGDPTEAEVTDGGIIHSLKMEK